jgi:hypothetical protein
MLTRKFGPERDEVTREWRKRLNDELSDLHSSPNIFFFFLSRRMRWACCVARMGERRVVYRVWWGNLRDRKHLEDQT